MIEKCPPVDEVRSPALVPDHETGCRNRRRDLLPLGILSGLGVFMAVISWFKWTEILVDFGRELYVPWRITEGEMLYRDIPHLYGPLAHYANALLFQVFGTSLRTLDFFNLFLVGILTLAIYETFRCGYDRLTGTLCGVTFLGVFAFSRYAEGGDSSFVSPYAHEMTYGIALFFVMVLALERFREQRTPLWAGATAFLLGLICLTKVEVAAAALVAAGTGVLLSAVRARSPRPFSWGVLAAACAGFSAPALFFVALFSSRATVWESLRFVVTAFTSFGHAAIVTNPLYRTESGLDRPAANAAIMLKVAAIYALLLLGIFVVARCAALFRDVRHRYLLAAGITLPLGIGAYLVRDSSLWWVYVGRPLPLFVMAYVVHLTWRYCSGPVAARDGRDDIQRIVVALFALLLLVKNFLSVSFFAPYGCLHSMAATLVLVALGAYHVPRAVPRWGGCCRTARLVAVAAILFVAAVHIKESMSRYAMLTYPVGQGKDTFFTYDPAVYYSSGPVFNEILWAIETMTPADANFVVLPEGVMLNYLARRRNPGRWFEFTPSYVETMGEERMCADLEAGRPEYVLLVDRTTAEFGATYFGTDYGFKLKAWIMDHYAPVYLAGSKVLSGQGFGIALAKRKDGVR